MSEENEKVIIIPGSEWRERVQKELTRLTERIVKLRQFMASEDFQKTDVRQRDLLMNQVKVMNKYANILAMRLQA